MVGGCPRVLGAGVAGMGANEQEEVQEGGSSLDRAGLEAQSGGDPQLPQPVSPLCTTDSADLGSQGEIAPLSSGDNLDPACSGLGAEGRLGSGNLQVNEQPGIEGAGLDSGSTPGCVTRGACRHLSVSVPSGPEVSPH